MTCACGSIGKYDKKVLKLVRNGYIVLDKKSGKCFGVKGREIGSIKKGVAGTTSYVKISLPVGKKMLNGRRKSAWIGLHRVMALAFLGLPPEGKDRVNHKDGNGLNNKLPNLEWTSAKENTQHAIHVTGTISQDGERNKMALLTEKQVREIMVSHLTDHELSSIYGVGPKTIQTVRYGMRWKHIFDEVSKTPEFTKAARRRSRNAQLAKAGITKKKAKLVLLSDLPALNASVKFDVKESTVARLRAAPSWQWLRNSIR